MPKTEFLQIRLTPEDRNRLRRAAAREYIDTSAWARRAMLQALDQWEDDEARGRPHLPAEQGPRDAPAILRVAEPKLSPKSKASPKSKPKPKPRKRPT